MFPYSAVTGDAFCCRSCNLGPGTRKAAADPLELNESTGDSIAVVFVRFSTEFDSIYKHLSL
jgi:hypothetical protein